MLYHILIRTIYFTSFWLLHDKNSFGGLKMIKLFKIFFIIALTIATASMLYSHASWIKIDSVDKNSKTIFLKIAHGHAFPEGGHKLNAEFVKLFTVDDSGKKASIPLDKSGDGLSASLNMQNSGTSRLCFTYLKGIMSKTTRGWKQGGKDLYPDAIQRMMQVVTGNAVYGSGIKELKKMSPSGLPVELLLEESGKTITLTLYKDSKPYPNANVYVQLPGKEEALIGKTDAKGTVKTVPPAQKGEMLFVADFKIEYPAGSDVNYENYSSSLYLRLE